MKKWILLAITILSMLILWQILYIISGVRDSVDDKYLPEQDIYDESDSLQLDLLVGDFAPHDVLIVSIEGDSLLLSDVSKDTTTLYCRYSLMGCRPCIDNSMMQAKRYTELHPDRPVTLLIRDISLRDLYVNQKEIGSSFKLYLCPEFPLDNDDLSSPLFFRIGPEGKIRDLYQVEYGKYSETSRYLFNL